MSYARRRSIVKVAAKNSDTAVVPFKDNGQLNKGFRYIGGGKVADAEGNEYLIADYK